MDITLARHATGSSDGQIMVVDGAPRSASRMRNKRRPKTAATARTRFFKGIHRKTITGIAFHRSQDLVVVSCSNDSTCEVYDVFDGEEVANTREASKQAPKSSTNLPREVNHTDTGHGKNGRPLHPPAWDAKPAMPS